MRIEDVLKELRAGDDHRPGHQPDQQARRLADRTAFFLMPVSASRSARPKSLFTGEVSDYAHDADYMEGRFG